MNYSRRLLLGTIRLLPLVGVFSLMLMCSWPEKGKLGMEVPVGKGKVTKTSPYVVIGVIEDGPAHRAGLLPDDIILQVDGRPLLGLEHDMIKDELLSGKAGTRVTLVTLRGDETRIIQVTRGR